MPYGQRDFRLDRMRELLARLGNPHQGLSIVHVAGTKGKGSTAAMIGSMLRAAGYRTGLYSSPHLHRVEERMMVDGVICPPDELNELIATRSAGGRGHGRPAPGRRTGLESADLLRGRHGVGLVALCRHQVEWRCWKSAWAAGSTRPTSAGRWSR